MVAAGAGVCVCVVRSGARSGSFMGLSLLETMVSLEL